MEYVMVPVPEEFAREVQLEVFKMTLRRASEGWTAELIEQLVHDSTPSQVALLRKLLQDHLVKRISSPTEIAEELGTSLEEVVARYESLLAYGDERELPLLIWTVPPRTLELERTIQTMFLPHDVARLLEAELAGRG